MTEQLCKTFITPLEREDIQALATALYKIPKTVEKIGERILICPQDLHGRSFAKQVEFLDQAAEAVLAMVKELRKGTDIATVRDMNDNLQTIEGDADKLELDLLRDLYHGNYDTKHMIFLRDPDDLLEVIDRCRDAATSSCKSCSSTPDRGIRPSHAISSARHLRGLYFRGHQRFP